MWESPINVMEIQDSFVSEIKEKTEEMIFTEIKRIGIDVDKEELIKALQYDRGQYEKGYSDGYANGIDEFAERLKEKYEHCVVNDILMNNDVMSYTNSCNVFESFIDEIAEEMRGAV